MATVAFLTERVRLIGLSLANSAKKGDHHGLAKWAHQLASASADLALVADPAHPAIVIVPAAPAAPAIDATSRLVADFGATPDVIFTRTIAAIKAAGKYVPNADGSWSGKSFADWRALFLECGGDAGVAAYDVITFNPLEIEGDLGNVPAASVAAVAKYWSGLFKAEGTWYAWKDGIALGTHVGDSDWAAWAEHIGLGANSAAWY